MTRHDTPRFASNHIVKILLCPCPAIPKDLRRPTSASTASSSELNEVGCVCSSAQPRAPTFDYSSTAAPDLTTKPAETSLRIGRKRVHMRLPGQDRPRVSGRSTPDASMFQFGGWGGHRSRTRSRALSHLRQAQPLSFFPGLFALLGLLLLQVPLTLLSIGCSLCKSTIAE